jgi:NhaA family Na+:H+ antiporter
MDEERSSERRPTWGRSDRLVPRLVLRPLQEFVQTSTASGLLLLIATGVAVIWANLPGDSYERLWATPLDIRLGSWSVNADVRFWVNEGLMALFFLVAGLEIKRELLTGELRGGRTAIVPVLAAIGGMVVPALLFIALAGDAGDRGWGAAMPTDIALTLGVLALAGSRAPMTLRPFLLTLAIVDDIATIAVLAIAYRTGFDAVGLSVAIVAGSLIVVADRSGVRATLVFVVLGGLVWVGFLFGGVHPALAGAVVGLLTPARPFQRPRAVSVEAVRTAESTMDDPDPPDADAPHWLRLATLSRDAVSPLARVEHILLPWTSYAILPLFALANAGVVLRDGAFESAMTSSVAAALVVARVLGKVVGIVGTSWLAVRSGLGSLPDGVRWPHLAGGALAAAIAFTVSLFVAEVAFVEGSSELVSAKVGVLASLVVAGGLAVATLRLTRQ